MTGESIGVFAPAVIGATAILVIWLTDARKYLYDFRLDESGIEFYVFHRIRLFNIPYEDVVEARYGQLFEYPFSAVNFANRRVGSMRRVLLVKKSGWVFRKMILTPEEPAVFLDLVRKKAGLESGN